MNLQIAQVIGLNTDQKAAQVVSSVREDDNAFLAVLELVSDDAFTKGRQILSQLEDFYFECEGSTAARLNITFKEAEKSLLKEGGFSICLAAISGKALYLIGKGQIEIYLKRGDKLSPLVSAEASSQLVSGFLQDGDRVLLATKSLVDFVGADLEKSLSLPIEAFEEEVGSKIGASDLENQDLAALVVEVSQPEPVLEGGGGERAEMAPVSVYDTAQESPKKISISFPAILSALTLQLSRLLSLSKQLGSRFPKSGRGRLIVAVVLIIIIALGAGYKYKTSRDRERQLQLSQLLQEAKDNFDAAKGLVSLNPAEAKVKLDLAKENVGKALSLQPGSSEAQNFKKQLEQESASVLQQSSVSNFPVFLDMDLVKKNFRATQMSLSGSKLLLMDPGVKTLVAIDLGKKSNQILAGSEQLGDASTFSLNGGLAFVYSKDKGVLKIDTTNSKITVAAKKDSEWGDIKDIYGFGGNVYLLDSGQIWKYVAAADGYSDKRAYLSKGVQVDFSNALRMQIESSIYVLKAGGEILRFTKGDKDNFSLGGLDKGVKDPKSIFVSSDTDDLYLLDSGNSRLVILTKTGSYKGQIGGDKFATATDLAVDEIGKKVYLLDGSKIYSVELK